MANISIILSYVIGVFGIVFNSALSLFFLLNLIMIISTGYGIISESPAAGSNILASIFSLVSCITCLVASVLLIIGLVKRITKMIVAFLIIHGIFFVLYFLLTVYQIVFFAIFWFGWAAISEDSSIFAAILFLLIALVILVVGVGIAIGLFFIIWKAKKSIEFDNANTFSNCYNHTAPMPIVHSVGQQIPANTPIGLNHGNNAAI